ncbi:hypothetical protein [Chryseobacterium sp. ON_d1]|uniref:hypothetical protein n=1 Tax=Chryseobacterium sp. ON_d1 TaxID=2583211 RepID=UPI001159C8DF|nr:hypothetical protein [Chryseobacterium sp. ON_d1]GEJ43532.1 hypothetical protein CRS_01400 [Chryseobacterium sp. ON_d1]
MKQTRGKHLSELTDQELFEKKKTLEANVIVNAIMVGLLAGIGIYSTITKGIGLMTFLPWILALWTVSNWNKNRKALKRELGVRNLK